LKVLVPDEPISVPDRGKQGTKWISNYDGQFKGMISLREALAESRNAVAIWIATQIGQKETGGRVALAGMFKLKGLQVRASNPPAPSPRIDGQF
jgi:membrane peptidoglycan carboxypeptidase